MMVPSGGLAENWGVIRLKQMARGWWGGDVGSGMPQLTSLPSNSPVFSLAVFSANFWSSEGTLGFWSVYKLFDFLLLMSGLGWEERSQCELSVPPGDGASVLSLFPLTMGFQLSSAWLLKKKNSLSRVHS